MPTKKLLAKIVSIGMIAFSVYQIFLSLNAIFFIYPKLEAVGPGSTIIEEGLVEKAILIYVSMFTNGLYGTVLFLKPSEKIKIFHIVTGILIFVGSIFFVVETPFTSGPFQKMIAQWIKTIIGQN